VLYDVTTLHFETDAGDGFREPGFSKERRLDPQITVGLLTDASGLPLSVAAFEGNRGRNRDDGAGDRRVQDRAQSE
jgi:transposase